MKKIFALILAIVMMASMSVVVFAEEAAAPADKEAGALGGETELVYGVYQAYEVEIPASTVFAGNDTDGYEADGTLKATGVKIAKNETFTITVVSAHNWTLADYEGSSDPVDYDILIGGNSIKVENTETVEGEGQAKDFLASATALTLGSSKEPKGAEKTVELDFYTKGTGQEGTYKDQLTFVVAIA